MNQVLFCYTFNSGKFTYKTVHKAVTKLVPIACPASN